MFEDNSRDPEDGKGAAIFWIVLVVLIVTLRECSKGW